jgi:hypothetical protein
MRCADSEMQWLCRALMAASQVLAAAAPYAGCGGELKAASQLSAAAATSPECFGSSACAATGMTRQGWQWRLASALIAIPAPAAASAPPPHGAPWHNSAPASAVALCATHTYWPTKVLDAIVNPLTRPDVPCCPQRKDTRVVGECVHIIRQFESGLISLCCGS